MTAQRTIAKESTCHGIGLHSGLEVGLTLRPAPVNTGVVFRRAVEGGTVEIPARPASIGGAANATTLSASGAQISTVEHLLAAIYCLGIDNVWVDMDGAEVPVMDGSAVAFVELLNRAGVADQGESRCRLKILKPVEVVKDSRRARIEPAQGFGVSYVIDFDHPAIGRQEFSAEMLNERNFAEELAAARTFGFMADVERLWQSGLAKGGSFENTVILDARGVLNPGGLRWPDEFVRHKVLDLIGDLSLLGVEIEGRAVVEKGGHAMHHALARKLVESPESWELCDVAAGVRPGWEVEGVGFV